MKQKDFLPMDRMLYARAAMTGRIPPGMTAEKFKQMDTRTRAERRREFKRIVKEVYELRKKAKHRG